MKLKEKRITVRLTYEEEKLLNLGAYRTKKTRAEFIRFLIKEHNDTANEIKENTINSEVNAVILRTVMQIKNSQTENHKEMLDKSDFENVDMTKRIGRLNGNIIKAIKAIVVINPRSEKLFRAFIDIDSLLNNK